MIFKSGLGASETYEATTARRTFLAPCRSVKPSKASNTRSTGVSRGVADCTMPDTNKAVSTSKLPIPTATRGSALHMSRINGQMVHPVDAIDVIRQI
jgi:hypothetical protein